LTIPKSADTVCEMDDFIPIRERPRQRWLDRIQALIEVLLLSGLVSGFFAVLPFTLRAKGSISLTKDVTTVALYLLLESWIAMLMLYVVMRAHGETPGDLGWRTRHWRVDSLIGAAIVPVLFICSAAVNYAFRTWLPHYYIEQNPLTQTIRTPRDLALFSLAALFAGGIKEELQRAFILIRFRDHLGGSGIGLLAWSLAFGAGHYVQGWQGVAAATLFGFLFGLVYLARRSLVAPIVAHSLYDTAALLGYWFTRSS
jgi:membrane protease YdiL (CAAX protease family)